jgi:hypothetical protein
LNTRIPGATIDPGFHQAMSTDRGSASERIWAGLCLLTLLLAALGGGFAWYAHQQRRDVESALERDRAQRWALDKVAAELSVQVQDLSQRVDELESENRELRQRLSQTTE